MILPLTFKGLRTMIKPLTDDTIAEVLFGKKALLILFYYDELPNLSDVMAVFEKYDTQFGGKLDVYKVDYRAEEQIAAHFSMDALPAMVLMKNNVSYASIAGPVSNMQYDEVIKKGLLGIMDARKEAASNTFESAFGTISEQFD